MFSKSSKKVKKKKIYCVVCGKYKKFKNPKILQIFKKKNISSFYYLQYKCDSKEEKIFKEAESINISKILDLINNIEKYQKNITEFRLKTIEEIILEYFE